MNATIAASAARCVRVARKTSETDIELVLGLDGGGGVTADTGIGMLDHMLEALGRHARFDMQLSVKGDLRVDDHHSSEDCALVLGQAIDELLGDRRGIARFGAGYAPLDEALARAVVDFSGRPWPSIELGLRRESIGGWACENMTHFFQSLAMSARCSLHVDVLKGANDHHRIEAAFKATAIALRMATRPDGTTIIPSTKGVLS